MRFPSFVAAWASAALLFSGIGHADSRSHELTLDVSSLLDFGHVFGLTPETLEKEFSKEGFQENPYLRWDSQRLHASFSEHPYSNIEVHLIAMRGEVPLTGAKVHFKEGKAQTVTFTGSKADEPTLNVLRARLSEGLGCKAMPGPRPMLGWKADAAGRSSLWESDKGVALLTVGDQFLSLALAPARTPPGMLASLPADRPPSLVNETSSVAEFFVRLDPFLSPPALWSLTPATFESMMKLPGSATISVNKQSPFYKWNTSARDSALLTRHVFSNTNTDLLMFDDAVNVEEALIEFRNGKAGKVTLTLLTRGNGGDKAADQFDKVFKAAGRAIGAMLKVQPIATVPAGRNLIKTQGYLWTTSHTLALMEFNDEAPKGRLEFLRLKLMPASGRAELLNLAGIGDTVTTKSKSSLATNVKKNPATGDVYLTGVPMIDQGQKGYCVSASCARVFNYLGVKCDQDEIAELVKNDAEKGTRPSDMYSALRKIDQRYNMRVKVVKLPRGFGLQGMRDTEVMRAQKGDLAKLAVENVSAGTPLLWAVALPFTPVEVRTGFPDGSTPAKTIQDPQMGGGHMRLIIGYNSKTGDVIFTDSWGAGHEIKRMSLRDAEGMTQAVFTMQPAQ